MGTDLDPAAEGLLDGVEGDARERLEALLKRLSEAGARAEELREAVDGGRLALLAAERVIAGGERYSAREIAERVELPLETLEAQWAALGMVIADPDERTRSRADLAAAERVRELLDAGLSAEAVEETARVMAMSLAQVAASHREMVSELVFDADEAGQELGIEREVEMAERLEAVTRALIPLIGPSLEHLYTLQLREQLRHAVIDTEARAPGVDEIAVGFADLVDFTRLGEQLPAEEFGEITRRFSRLATEVAGGPVRLVKMIGDAAMFSSPEPAVLAAALLELLERVEAEADFPALRAGMSWGSAVSRGGDLYGRPVNLASRLTGVARPGSLLVAAEQIEPLEQAEDLRLSDAGHKRLKGIDGAVHMYRVRHSPEATEEDRGEGGEDAGDGDDVEADEAELSGGRRSRRRRARRSGPPRP